MKIAGKGSAGTAESGDALVVVEAAEEGVELELSGPSIPRYGEEIRSTILATLRAIGIDSAKIRLQEKGALDCTIRARLLAACGRAAAAGTDSRIPDTAIPQTAKGAGPKALVIPWEALP